MVQIYSFDVFDTCLVRKAAFPSGVFYSIATDILHLKKESGEESKIEDFVSARIFAEKTARTMTEREDVSLRDIWKLLAENYGLEFEESLMEIELKHEAAALAPVRSIINLIKEVRGQGHRVIFTSDMYLPADFIFANLLRFGLAEPGDGIYVSGEIGKGKYTGNLFRHIFSVEKCSASDVVHIGDNKHSDFNIPRSLGMQSRLVNACSLSHLELNILRRLHSRQAAIKISGTIRTSRLQEEEADDGIRELAHQFAGPFVMAFAVWMLQRARDKGFKRLYFFSRDCQLVWRVAKLLAPHFGDIDCRYLYVSRQALYLPACEGISPEFMPWMMKLTNKPALKSLLAKIELKFEEVKEHLTGKINNLSENSILETEADKKVFWDMLQTSPMRERIIGTIEERRKAAEEYFRDSGLLDDIPWASVDLGWWLSGQTSLRQLLKRFGFKREIQGFYLGLKSGRIPSAYSGASEALIYEPAADSPAKLGLSVFTYQTHLEHLVGSADHPSVHHYQSIDGKSSPVFVDKVSPHELLFCNKLHQQVLEFVSRNMDLLPEFKHRDISRETIEAVTESFFKHPTEKQVRALHGLSIATDQNNMDIMPMARPMGITEVLLPIIPPSLRPKNGYNSTPFFWREACLAVTPERTKQIGNLIEGICTARDMITHKIALRSRFRRLLSRSKFKII